MASASVLKALTTGYLDIQYSRYAHLSAGMILFYDHLITLDQEVDLIWMEPWSFGRLLFLINRYYALVSAIVDFYGFFSPSLIDSFCHRFTEWQGWTGIGVSLIAQAILQLRIYAMYPSRKFIIYSMIALYIASACASFIIMALFLSTFESVAMQVPGGRFCVSSNKKVNFFHALWIPMLVFETFLCTLAVVKGIEIRQTLREHHIQGEPATRNPFSLFDSGKRLTDILFRDSIMYFAAIGATYFATLLVWQFGSKELQQTPLGFVVAFPCVIANRLILNIRGAGREQSQITHYDFYLESKDMRSPAADTVSRPLTFAVRTQLSV